MAVRWEASTPAVTSSAVDADPNPLGPGMPVASRKSPMVAGGEVDGDVEGEEGWRGGIYDEKWIWCGGGAAVGRGSLAV